MNMLKLITLALTTTSLCAPAIAQETGTLIQRKAAQIHGTSKTDARRTVLEFAACLISRSPGRADKMVALPISAREYQIMYRNLYDTFDDECLSSGDTGGVQLRFSPTVFRAGLFEELYRRNFGRKGPTDFQAVTTSGYRELYGDAVADPEVRNAIAIKQFGECVTRADGAGVRELMTANAGSADEAGTFTRLAPRLGACLPKGEKIAFSKPILKGALAEGIYRLSLVAVAEVKK